MFIAITLNYLCVGPVVEYMRGDMAMPLVFCTLFDDLYHISFHLIMVINVLEIKIKIYCIEFAIYLPVYLSYIGTIIL